MGGERRGGRGEGERERGEEGGERGEEKRRQKEEREYRNDALDVGHVNHGRMSSDDDINQLVTREL